MNCKIFWIDMDSCVDCAKLVKVDEAAENENLYFRKDATLVMSGCIFNAGALSKSLLGMRITVCFDDDTHDRAITNGYDILYDSALEKLIPFSAMILVQEAWPKSVPLGRPVPIFKAHGILLQPELGGSHSSQPVTRRFHRVGAFCIEISGNDDDLIKNFMIQLYQQKDTIRIN